jgi:hypothetical protein
LKMLDYALHYWYSDKREVALGQLIRNEQYLNQINGWDTLGTALSDDELYGDDDLFFDEETEHNLLGKTQKNNTKKSKTAQRKTARKAKAKPKGFFKKVGNGLKKIGKGIVRFNPATIAARNGFLLALKANMGKLSEKLKWAFASPQQAQTKGVAPDTINKAKNALAKIEKLFSKIGGKPANLRKAILSAKKGKLNGLGTLGAAPAAAAIAAATPIIVAAINIMKTSGLVSPKEQIDLSKSGAEDEVSYEDHTTQTKYPTADTLTDYANQNDSNKEPYKEPYTEEYSESNPEANGEELLEGLGSLTNGLFQFAQNNPMLGIAVGGTIAYGLYQISKQDSEKPSNRTSKPKTLAGIRTSKVTPFQMR